MKTNFAKKIIKILTAVFLVFFLLFVYVKAQEDTNPYTNPGLTTGSIVYFDEETETYPCSDSVNGECVMKTRKYKKDKNIDGYEITQVIQKPNDGISGGTISEYYTDNEGQKWYKTGNVNQNDETTSLGSWEKGEKTEIKTKTADGEKFTYTLLQPLPKASIGGKDLKENVTLKEYLAWAFRFTLALAGFLAVMMIVIGGVEYIISGANESARTEANKRIWGAISGLVIALVAYLVLYTINPSLVNFNNNQFFKEKTTEGGETGDTTDVVFDVIFPSTETQGCDFSSSGECYLKTEKYEEGDKEITQIMEKPTAEGGITQVHESYMDKEGRIFFRRGIVNTDGTITYTREWEE